MKLIVDQGVIIRAWFEINRSAAIFKSSGLMFFIPSVAIFIKSSSNLD